MTPLNEEPSAAPIPELRKAVAKWLYENGHSPDYMQSGCKLYSHEEWIAKGETIGASSALTIISEGNLCQLWGNDPCCDSEPLLSLKKAVEELGYYPELGFSWSMHFNPSDTDDYKRLGLVK